MSHPSKVKGDRAEREVVALLRALGFPHAERAYGAGRDDDRGDIDGIPGVVVSVKAEREWRPHEWLAEADEQAWRDEADTVAVFTRRPGGRYVVLLTPERWAQLMRDAGHAPPLPRPPVDPLPGQLTLEALS